MPKPNRITADQLDRVRSGELHPAGLADELGVGRQTIHRQLRRLGVLPAPRPAKRKRPEVELHHLQSAQELQDEREPDLAPEEGPPDARPHSAAAAGAAIDHLTPTLPAAVFASPDDLLTVVREIAANNAMMALARVAEVLAAKPGAGAVRLALQGQLLALDQLDRLGVDLDPAASAGPPQMLFVEMTADEIEEAQRQAEAAHQGLDLDDDDQDQDQGDDLDDQDAEAAA